MARVNCGTGGRRSQCGIRYRRQLQLLVTTVAACGCSLGCCRRVQLACVHTRLPVLCGVRSQHHGMPVPALRHVDRSIAMSVPTKKKIISPVAACSLANPSKSSSQSQHPFVDRLQQMVAVVPTSEGASCSTTVSGVYSSAPTAILPQLVSTPVPASPPGGCSLPPG